MRQRKALAGIVLVLAAIAFAAPQDSWAEQAGARHGRPRGGAAWSGSAAGGGASGPFTAPYYYRYGYPPVFPGTSSPYDNPYTSRSSGCCHGRN
jgi:hypothetical protein